MSVPVRRAVQLLFAIAPILISGCANGGGNPTPQIVVQVMPPTVTVNTGQTQQFTASVTGTTNTRVTWQVSSSSAGAASIGTISASGLYTAPATVPAGGTVTVTATSQADTSKTASATVTVTSGQPIAVTLSPKTVTIQADFSQQFTATVSNTTNTAVTWQVNGVNGGNSTVGTISASGLYIAPAAVPNPAAVTIKAISQADNTKFDTATVNVNPPVTVSVSPKTVNVTVLLTQQFTATVGNNANTTVIWQVNGVTGGNSTVGTISATGLYTAPSLVPNPAAVTVKAISQIDNQRSDTATVTVIPAVPAVTVTVSPKTPTVQIGLTQQFTATVTNTANTAVTWQVNNVTGGDSTNGTISGAGLYTAPAAVPAGNPVTVKAISQADNTKSDSATVTISTASGIAVSVTPVRGGLTVTQQLSLTPTVNGDALNQGVSWSFTSTGSTTGGSFSSATSASGTPVTFTAPTGAGVVTVIATSVSDVTKSASATIGVTDLAGVFSYHNDNARDGVNAQEYALTTANVKSATFGKLFSCNMDGAVYAQPLWVANVTIGGGKHNVIVAVSMRDTVYAFDADAGPTCVQYWSKSMLPSGETFVPSGDLLTADIYPDIGILGTPAIDPSTNAVYLIAKSKTTSGAVYHQRLHALNLADGSERTNSPKDLTETITYPGSAGIGDVTCPPNPGNAVPFCALRLNQRPALAFDNGVVYASWASHGDNGPYHGWVVGFNASTLAVTGTFNTTPNGGLGGIWMSGGAPAIDAAHNLYMITGNGDWDGVTEFGDSVIKLNPSTLTLGDWFTPAGQAALNNADLDFGSGGAVVLADAPSAPHPHMMIGGGKGSSGNGELYVLNRDSLGHQAANDAQALQIIVIGSGIFATEAYWNNTIYIAGAGTAIKAFAMNPNTGVFNTSTVPQTPTGFGFPGATPSISSLGATNGIVWALQVTNYGTNNQGGRTATPIVLHAYDATNIATELWNSSMSAADTAGNSVKFTVPTIANGKVYVPSRGSDTTNPATASGRIDVYGLKPN